jgi:hypothetical protein
MAPWVTNSSFAAPEKLDSLAAASKLFNAFSGGSLRPIKTALWTVINLKNN